MFWAASDINLINSIKLGQMKDTFPLTKKKKKKANKWLGMGWSSYPEAKQKLPLFTSCTHPLLQLVWEQWGKFIGGDFAGEAFSVLLLFVELGGGKWRWLFAL